LFVELNLFEVSVLCATNVKVASNYHHYQSRSFSF